MLVRSGPWSHGEMRNGGFPDWVQNSGLPLRTQNPEYIKLFMPYWTQLTAEWCGLLWKDGGPVIGIQVDNEWADVGYLLTLKRIARSLGVDVPFYTMTGWSGRIPQEGLLPLTGAYADGYGLWMRSRFGGPICFPPGPFLPRPTWGRSTNPRAAGGQTAAPLLPPPLLRERRRNGLLLQSAR